MAIKQEREQAFHDAAFTESTRAPIWGFYRITGVSQRAFHDLLLAEGLMGKRVLELGSGANPQAFFLAAHGAEVVVVDISPVAVEHGRRRAAHEHLDKHVAFSVMDVESLEFPDSTFDVVCGSAVLHHVDVARAYSQIARVLRPGGWAIFVEPLGHNPIINAYRKRTPAFRTVDEHPLLLSDLEDARQHFGAVDLQFFHLASLAAIPFRDRRRFSRLLAALERVDSRLLSTTPLIQKHAWMVVLRLREPINRGADLDLAVAAAPRRGRGADTSA